MAILKATRQGNDEPKDAANHQSKTKGESSANEGDGPVTSPTPRAPLGRFLHLGSIPSDKKKSYITKRIDLPETHERRTSVSDALDHVLSPPTKSLFRMRRASMGSSPELANFSCLDDDDDSFSNDDLKPKLKKKKKKKVVEQDAAGEEDVPEEGKTVKKKKKKKTADNETFDVEAPQFDLALEISKATKTFESGFLPVHHPERPSSYSSLQSDALDASENLSRSSLTESPARVAKVKAAQKPHDEQSVSSKSSQKAGLPPMGPSKKTTRHSDSSISSSGVSSAPKQPLGGSVTLENEEAGTKSPRKQIVPVTPRKSSSLRSKTSPIIEGKSGVSSPAPKKNMSSSSLPQMPDTLENEEAGTKSPRKQTVSVTPRKSSSLRSKTSPVTEGKSGVPSPVRTKNLNSSFLPPMSAEKGTILSSPKKTTCALSSESSSLRAAALQMRVPVSPRRSAPDLSSSSSRPPVSPRRKSFDARKLLEATESKPSSSSSITSTEKPTSSSSNSIARKMPKKKEPLVSPEDEAKAQGDSACEPTKEDARKRSTMEVNLDADEEHAAEIGTMDLNDVEGGGSARKRPSRRARPSGGGSSHSRSRSLPLPPVSRSSSSNSIGESSVPKVRIPTSASPKRQSRSRSVRSHSTATNVSENTDSSHSRSSVRSSSFSGRSRRSASPSSLRSAKNRTRISQSSSNGGNPLEKLQSGMTGDTSSVETKETESTSLSSTAAETKPADASRQQRRSSLSSRGSAATIRSSRRRSNQSAPSVAQQHSESGTAGSLQSLVEQAIDLQSQPDETDVDSVSLSTTSVSKDDANQLPKAQSNTPVVRTNNPGDRQKDRMRHKSGELAKTAATGGNVLDSSIVLEDIDDKDMPKLSSLSICTLDASVATITSAV